LPPRGHQRRARRPPRGHQSQSVASPAERIEGISAIVPPGHRRTVRANLTQVTAVNPGMETGPPGESGLAISNWTSGRDLAGLVDPTAAGRAAHDMLNLGLLGLPQSGHGRTPERIEALIALGVADCVLARLAEGHADAVAILAELGGPDPGADRLWGVWAAQPPGMAPLKAECEGRSWWLEGEKPYCSGAAACDSALVTAIGPNGNQLLAVDLRQPGVEPIDGTWPALGMAGSDSRTVRFERVAAVPVGQPGAYLARPGFWHGAVGVAACWMGGAVGVAHALGRAATQRELDPHALAHLGAIDGAVVAMRSTLLGAARELDLDPEDHSGRAALIARRTRTVVEWGASLVLERVGRALGAGPLTQDAAHSRRVADLTVYLRQSHAERDLFDHGKRLLEVGMDW
jgi:alkylation response protein AidB-like acyl-CoA dehydrogenase